MYTGKTKGNLKMKKFTKILALILVAILSLSLFAGCGDVAEELLNIVDFVLDSEQVYQTDFMDEGGNQPHAPPSENDAYDGDVREDGVYTSRDQVAAYLNEYGKLPSNYITKSQARDLGWNSSQGNLEKVAPGKSIGGDSFGNYEGRLPKANGRKYYECDINYDGGYRGSERIVYSNDGLIYYTSDHYETFILLYKDGVKQ
jgi:hypothetical protein